MAKSTESALNELISDYEDNLPTIAIGNVSTAKSALEGQIREEAEKHGYKVSFLANFKVVIIED